MRRMMSFYLFALGLLFGPPLVPLAQTSRTWVYSHNVVKDSQDQQVAEVSEITSTDPEPMQQRFLVKLGSQLLVTRYTIGEPTPFNNSYTLLATGETLSIDNPTGSTFTVTLAGNSFSFEEGQEGSSSVRAQADVLINKGSEAFRSTLRQFATIGLNTYTPLYSQGIFLRTIFFSDLTFGTSPHGMSQETARVKNFNPNTTAPSQYDTAFGPAYFQ